MKYCNDKTGMVYAGLYWVVRPRSDRTPTLCPQMLGILKKIKLKNKCCDVFVYWNSAERAYMNRKPVDLSQMAFIGL